ncbi:helix-turn-helix domain-containing protein [Acidisoma silvae]|uniref:Helix-turn-helix transcriptional regulator n=1 Tax=Acidisoma silvae TaxID=2802396 RepID=A0A964DZ96_9PROT|nr:helix-turn-helix transcriptional regulator [Acidisoma silvae]MCB8875433.1 helix-turn-helix transcriptional regulator [Acidisoma silvae]
MSTALTRPKIIESDDDTVTLNRDEWQSFVENAEDLASVAKFQAFVAEIGLDRVKHLGFTGQEAAKMLDGASPITIRRERAGMTQRALAQAADISPSYLAEIETGKKPGSLAVMAAIASVFGVPIENLMV